MKREDVFTEVKKILTENLGVKEEEVKEESSLVDDLGADSLDGVEIIMAVEEHFDIEIDDEMAETMTTTGIIVDTVMSNLES